MPLPFRSTAVQVGPWDEGELSPAQLCIQNPRAALTTSILTLMAQLGHCSASHRPQITASSQCHHTAQPALLSPSIPENSSHPTLLWLQHTHVWISCKHLQTLTQAHSPRSSCMLLSVLGKITQGKLESKFSAAYLL